MANRSLSEAELEWRRNLGARIRQAAENSGLSVSALAELIRDSPPNVSQYVKGLRHVPEGTLSAIARVCGVTVGDLCADAGEPLHLPAKSSRCREQLAVECSGPMQRSVLLLFCDKPSHSLFEACHDPRGFTWRADPATAALTD